MKKLFTLSLLLLAFTNFAQAREPALQLTSGVSGSPLRPYLALQCSGKSGESLCKDYCGDGKRCEWKESSCRGCLGTATAEFRLLFETPEFYFYAGAKKDFRGDVLPFLEKGNFVAAHPRSIYNFSTRFEDEALTASYAKLCPPGPGPLTFASILVETDATTQFPREARFLVCGFSDRIQAYVLERN